MWWSNIAPAVGAAIIAAIATVVVGILANWDKIRPNKTVVENHTDRKAEPPSSKAGRSPLRDSNLQPFTFYDDDSILDCSHSPSGDRRTKIEVLQLLLRSSGFEVRVDGILGPQTTRALIDFQKKHGLAATGVSDEGTVAMLMRSKKLFEEDQRRLLRLNYTIGIDGLCGRISSEALRQFQSDNEIDVTGLPNPRTRRKLRELVDLL